MARYNDAACRLCRREGQKLYLKGDRCYSSKCAISRRSYVPGQHGKGRKKVTEYGLQLRAKQATRRHYGILEKQFRHYYDLAKKMEGKTGEELLSLIETRLDNVVYRMGFAPSRPMARQMVNHGHFMVNGKKVNIPSYLTKPGDVISCTESGKKLNTVKALLEKSSSSPVPQWIEFDKQSLSGKIVKMPRREDIDLEVEETLIVEWYSKL